MSAAHAAPRRRARWPLILAALPAGLAAGTALLMLLFVGALLGAPPPRSGDNAARASPLALHDIPADYLALYRAAAERYGLDWSYLAAIGKLETDHGRLNAPGVRSGQNTHGCCAGPMQFWTAPPHPNTWDRYGVDGNRDGDRDPYNPADAIPAAARYLKAAGAPEDWRRAIFAYNHAGWYVDRVTTLAAQYRAANDASALETGGRLAWPLRGPITSPFGPRDGRMHAGIDIAAPEGTPVHAPADGDVTFAGSLAGYGLFVCVTHAPRLTTCSAHLSQINVRDGDRVQRGQVIGRSGCTGRCFGAHMHFEVHAAAHWSHASAIDPLDLLAERR